MLEVGGPHKERKLVCRAFASDGRELWAQEVTGDALRPAK